MPAFNQLAIYYLETAKQKAGRAVGKRVSAGASKEKKVETQALELAALVCSQAVRKNPNYAPIHNTAGMIQVELSNLNTAVQAFNNARKLDPSFYEAQMNFAAVNLQFRGFAQAEDAYRAALKMRPNDYDARLGLALALRGQIDDSNFDKMVAAASAELDAAKKIAPDRPETYYNEAILTQEYKAKSGGKDAEPMLIAAKGLFSQFVQKAGSTPEFGEPVKRSKERMEEIDQIIAFNKQTEAERKNAEAELKQKEAEKEAGAGATGEPTQ
jgi:tetratricopeptide (TPR) repeat protein